MSTTLSIKLTKQQIQWLCNIDKRRKEKSSSDFYRNDISFLVQVIINKQKQKIQEYIDANIINKFTIKRLKKEANKRIEDTIQQNEYNENIKTLLEAGYKKNDYQNKLIIEQQLRIDILEKQEINDIPIQPKKLNSNSPHIDCSCVSCNIYNVSNELHCIYEDLEYGIITETEAITDLVYSFNNNNLIKKITTKENSVIIKYYKQRIIELKNKIQQLKS